MATTTAEVMPDYATVYAYVRSLYRHDRFEGRNGAWCPDYSHVVARSVCEDLERRGFSAVGQHESATGHAIYFDRTLREIPSPYAPSFPVTPPEGR
jgi:hypothetical protein